MSIAHTRAMIRAALTGALDGAQFVDDPVFRVAVPTHCPGVPDQVLTPRDTWSRPSDYDAYARKLAAMFRDNFDAFAAAAGPDVAAAGPC